jgi:hypothetical protein
MEGQTYNEIKIFPFHSMLNEEASNTNFKVYDLTRP